MSFYTALFGQNPQAEQVLNRLDIRKEDVRHFRDCWWENDAIVILSAVQNPHLTAHPLFSHEEPDAFERDSTWYYFRTPN